MEDEPYSDQLIRALQKLRARAEEIRGQNNGQVPPDSRMELIRMHGEGRPIREAWFKGRKPPPLAPGADSMDLVENDRKSRHALAQETEYMAADYAIDIDFSVEAIDNAIHVIERQVRDAGELAPRI
jgi:hypothetical protein